MFTTPASDLDFLIKFCTDDLLIKKLSPPNFIKKFICLTLKLDFIRQNLIEVIIKSSQV